MSYRAGVPGWKLAARAGMRIKLRVDVLRDDEAGVYVATSSDLPGLTVEAETFDELRQEIHTAAAELLGLALQQQPAPLRAKTEIRMSDSVFCAT